MSSNPKIRRFALPGLLPQQVPVDFSRDSKYLIEGLGKIEKCMRGIVSRIATLPLMKERKESIERQLLFGLKYKPGLTEAGLEYKYTGLIDELVLFFKEYIEEIEENTRDSTINKESIALLKKSLVQAFLGFLNELIDVGNDVFKKTTSFGPRAKIPGVEKVRNMKAKIKVLKKALGK